MYPANIPLNLDFDFIRSLIKDIGLSQTQIAESLYISKREFRSYLFKPTAKTYKPMPYTVYYTLYVWAAYERYRRKNVIAD